MERLVDEFDVLEAALNAERRERDAADRRLLARMGRNSVTLHMGDGLDSTCGGPDFALSARGPSTRVRFSDRSDSAHAAPEPPRRASARVRFSDVEDPASPQSPQ